MAAATLTYERDRANPSSSRGTMGVYRAQRFCRYWHCRQGSVRRSCNNGCNDQFWVQRSVFPMIESPKTSLGCFKELALSAIHF
jgi:hypothetical protein